MVRAADVRVVVAEGGELTLLPLLLDAAGIDVIGAVNSIGVLGPMVASMRPDVVVLDMEIGAEAMAAAHSAHPSVALVVVWPAAVAAIGADVHVLPGVGQDELADAVIQASRLSHSEEIVFVPDVVEESPAPAPAPAAAALVGRRTGKGKLAAAASLALILLSAGLAAINGGNGRVIDLAEPPTTSIPHSPGGRGGDGTSTNGGQPVGSAPIVLAAAHSTVQQPAPPSEGPQGGSGGGPGTDSPSIRKHEKPRSIRHPEHKVSQHRGSRGRDHRHPRPPRAGGGHGRSESHGHDR